MSGWITQIKIYSDKYKSDPKYWPKYVLDDYIRSSDKKQLYVNFRILDQETPRYKNVSVNFIINKRFGIKIAIENSIMINVLAI